MAEAEVMEPVSPVIAPEFQTSEVVYAKDQPQYNPLPVLRRADGILLSRWKLSDEERKAITEGADIHLFIWTFNMPLHPLKIEVAGVERNKIDTASFMGLVQDEPAPTD